jgi:hypothetical protein
MDEHLAGLEHVETRPDRQVVHEVKRLTPVRQSEDEMSGSGHRVGWHRTVVPDSWSAVESDPTAGFNYLSAFPGIKARTTHE